MNQSDAMALLAELAKVALGKETRVGIAGQAPYSYAFLKISSPDDDSNWAEVASPGDGWYELRIPGGFATGETGDGYDIGDVREVLSTMVMMAISYVDGNWTAGHSKVFGLPFVVLRTNDGAVKLRLPVKATVKRILRLGN